MLHKACAVLCLSGLSMVCLAEDWTFSPTEEYIWVSSSGETTPSTVQDNYGGYIVTDAQGNQSWVDNLEEPNCVFTANKVDNYGDSTINPDEIKAEVYIDYLDFSGCNYE